MICFIDTPELIPVWARRRGLSEAVARSILTMANLRTPIIAVIIGEGGSGGAGFQRGRQGSDVGAYNLFGYITGGLCQYPLEGCQRTKRLLDFRNYRQDVLKLCG